MRPPAVLTQEIAPAADNVAPPKIADARVEVTPFVANLNRPSEGVQASMQKERKFAEPLERVQTIGDGFQVNARIMTFRATDAVKVPVPALYRAGRSGPYSSLPTIVPGSSRSISAAGTLAKQWSRTELSPGEQVVIYPSPALYDRARIVAGLR